MLANPMLDKLRALLGRGQGAANPSAIDDLTLSAAALLIYGARLDGTVDDDEMSTVRELLSKRFELSDAATEALIADADEKARGTVDLYSLTRDIKDALSPEDRIGVIEMLWAVIYADRKVSDYETNLVRRVAGLLYVSDVDSGAARKRVAEKLGLDQLPPM
ncbi:MAG: TerB family tellurite resistance protein [Rhodospirillales bacterium]|nr:TerB family tellurite resistance protein [Rhodospirillales bacterium]